MVSLLKTLYWLKNSTCQWVSLLSVGLKNPGLKSVYSDLSVYVSKLGTAKVIFVVVYTGPDMG